MNKKYIDISCICIFSDPLTVGSNSISFDSFQPVSAIKKVNNIKQVLEHFQSEARMHKGASVPDTTDNDKIQQINLAFQACYSPIVGCNSFLYI